MLVVCGVILMITMVLMVLLGCPPAVNWSLEFGVSSGRLGSWAVGVVVRPAYPAHPAH